MQTWKRCVSAVALIAVGYVLGVAGPLAPRSSSAQEEQADGPSKDAVEKIKTAYESIGAAMAALRQDKRYNSAFEGVNAFAVLSGGADAVQDLETGRGVDPETFAALYAELATEAVAAEIDRDDQGRVTYKGKVVRMYPISRLKKMFAERIRISGVPE